MVAREVFAEQAKVIFINRFFFPDVSATSQILTDLAFHLAAEGRAVHVITSRQRYDDPDAGLLGSETIKGVQVHRVATSHFGRALLLGRALDYLSFYLGSLWRLWRLAGPGDVIVAETDPPLLSVVVAPVVRMRRATLVNWLHDLFPEVASALGVRLLTGRLGRWVGRLRDASLRFAKVNVVLGEREKAFLLRRGVREEQIRTIHNWSDDEAIQPIRADRNPLRRDWGLGGKFVVEHSGNLGRAHDVETILTAAEQLNASSGEGHSIESERCTGDPHGAGPPFGEQPTATHSGEEVPKFGDADVVFVFIGGGHRYEWLQQEAARRGLRNVMFHPYQPRERLLESLGVGDLHLISLLPEMEGLIVPSKFYGIASAGRPTVFVGDADGEIARLLASGKCGVTVAPGDGAALAGWIRHLKDDAPMRRQWGDNARKLLDERFTQAMAFEAWGEVIEEEAPTGAHGQE